MKRNLIAGLLCLIILSPAFSQNTKLFRPLPNSFYSKIHFENDNINFIDDVVWFGKREMPARDVAKIIAKDENTVVFDATVPLQDVFEFIEDPSKLAFKNGHAYIEVQDGARFLTEVHIEGTSTIPEAELRKELNKFSTECITLGYEPDLIEVEFTSDPVKYAILAIKLTPEGKVTLYERTNSRTTRVFHFATNEAYTYRR